MCAHSDTLGSYKGPEKGWWWSDIDIFERNWLPQNQQQGFSVDITCLLLQMIQSWHGEWITPPAMVMIGVKV